MLFLYKKIGKKDFRAILLKQFDIHIEDNHIFSKKVQFQVDSFINF